MIIEKEGLRTKQLNSIEKYSVHWVKTSEHYFYILS